MNEQNNLTNQKNYKAIIIPIVILVLAAVFGYLLKIKLVPLYQQTENKTLEKPNNKLNSDNDIRLKELNQDDHLLGDLRATVKIIFYGDFDCQFSADYYETLLKAKSEYGDKIVIGFRHYPFRYHDLALPAALASECAAEQGKFWEMADKLFTSKKQDKLNVEQFSLNAQELGLDGDKFQQCFQAEKYKNKIQNDWQGGKDANVLGPPESFINSTHFSGALPWDDYNDQTGVKQDGFKSVIDKLLLVK